MSPTHGSDGRTSRTHRCDAIKFCCPRGNEVPSVLKMSTANGRVDCHPVSGHGGHYVARHRSAPLPVQRRMQGSLGTHSTVALLANLATRVVHHQQLD